MRIFEISHRSKRMKLKLGIHREFFLLKQNTSIRNALLSVCFEKIPVNLEAKIGAAHRPSPLHPYP